MHPPLTKPAIEAAAIRLGMHYEHAMNSESRRDYGYILVHLAHEVRLNLCAPRASYVPGRSPEELSRLCVFAHATAVAFETPELAADWEMLSRGMAASIGPRPVQVLSGVVDSSPSA